MQKAFNRFRLFLFRPKVVDISLGLAPARPAALTPGGHSCHPSLGFSAKSLKTFQGVPRNRVGGAAARPVALTPGGHSCHPCLVARLLALEGEAVPLCSLIHLAPNNLHPTPYTLRPTPYALHPTSFTLHPTPCTSHPAPHTLHHALQGLRRTRTRSTGSVESWRT